MQNQTAPIPHGVPESFYSKFGHHVTAILSGFDRIRFRGTLRMLFEPALQRKESKSGTSAFLSDLRAKKIDAKLRGVAVSNAEITKKEDLENRS